MNRTEAARLKDCLLGGNIEMKGYRHKRNFSTLTDAEQDYKRKKPLDLETIDDYKHTLDRNMPSNRMTMPSRLDPITISYNLRNVAKASASYSTKVRRANLTEKKVRESPNSNIVEMNNNNNELVMIKESENKA